MALSLTADQLAKFNGTTPGSYNPDLLQQVAQQAWNLSGQGANQQKMYGSSDIGAFSGN